MRVGRLPLVSLLLSLVILGTAATADAASPKRTCNTGCSQALSSCISSARALRAGNAVLCADKPCRRDAKKAFGVAKRACRQARPACRTCCRGGGAAECVTVGVARIAIVPGSVLLTAAGATRVLEAQAFDAAGNRLALPVTWTSSAPDVVEVDAVGRIAAVAAVGASLIVAEAGGVRSPAAFVLVAPPPADAVLVRDAQVVGEPQPIDPDAPLDVGARYRVTLRDTPVPPVGTILLAAESAPVSGRVVEAVDQNGEVVVTLEVVPLRDLFTALEIDVSIDLQNVEIAVPDDVRALYDVATQADGTFVFTPKSAAAAARVADGVPRPLAGAVGTRAIGIFECEVTPGLPLVTATVAELSVAQNLAFDLVYDSNAGGLQRMALRGSIKGVLKTEAALAAAFQGALECKRELVTLTLPIGGPLSLIFGAQVPLGVGFKGEGKATVASVGYEGSAEAGATVEVGLVCPGGTNCDVLRTATATATGDVKPKNLPNFVDDVTDFFDTAQIKLGFGVFGYAELAIGNRFLQKLRFKTFEVKAGLGGEVTAQSLRGQLLGPDQAEAKLSLDAEAGTASAINQLANLLSISVASLKLQTSVPLAHSPTATKAEADTDAFDAGRLVTFTVDLDPVNLTFIPTIYNVKEVRIYRIVDVLGTPRAVQVANALPSSGQSHFSLTWIASDVGSITGKFFAVALAGIPPLVLLELAPVTGPPGTVVVGGRSASIEVSAGATTNPKDEKSTEAPPGFTTFSPSPLSALVTAGGARGAATASQTTSIVAGTGDGVQSIPSSASVQASQTTTTDDNGFADSKAEYRIAFQVDNPRAYTLSGNLTSSVSGSAAENKAGVRVRLFSGGSVIFSAIAGDEPDFGVGPRSLPVTKTETLPAGNYELNVEASASADSDEDDGETGSSSSTAGWNVTLTFN
jgi:hypothetical protein